MNRIFVLLFGALILGGGLFSTQAVYFVDETNFAVVEQFGQITAVRTAPGLNLKIPLIQQVTYLEKRLISLDTPEQEYLTSDEKRILVDQVTRWRISDPQRFFLTARTEIGGASRLQPLVESELRSKIAGEPYDVMISAFRDTMMGKVKSGVQDRVDESGLGIEVVDVRTKRADLPPDVEQSVFDRMESARRVAADRHRATGQREADTIKSETDRLVSVMLACADRVSQETRGEGEAKAIAIFAEGLEQDPEFYSFLRRLEAYGKTFSGEDRLILSSDSNFFKLLSGEIAGLPEVEIASDSIKALRENIIQPLTTDEVETLIQECIPKEIETSPLSE